MTGKAYSAPDLPLYFYVLTRKQYYSHVNTRCVNEVITGVMRLCLEHGVPRNELGVKDVDQAIGKFLQQMKMETEKQTSNMKKKSTWFSHHSHKFLNKTYKNLDTSNLLDITRKVTEIRPENKDPSFRSLWKSVREMKNIRNDVVHDDNDAAYSEQTLKRISVLVNEIVDKLGTSFVIKTTEIDSIKLRFQNEIQRIKDSQQTNDDYIKSEITQRVIDENGKKWVPKIMKSMQFEKLQFGNERVPRREIFHETEFEVMLVSNLEYQDFQDSQYRKSFPCTEILTMEMGTNVDIIEGDPGSGKSTYLKMMCIEFCKRQHGSIFKSISSYQIMFLINCREKENITNFWQFFETYYKKTARIFPEKWVISALREMKIIIGIDGLDEANEQSNTLIRDFIHHFAGTETVKFLITTRPGFSKNVMEEFDKRAIEYRVLNIRPIVDINDQEKFIRRVVKHIPAIKVVEIVKPMESKIDQEKIISRVIKQIPAINVEQILKTFRAKHADLNSHFQRPLGLILFIALFHYFPDKIEKLTHELSLMQLSYEMHSENMTSRMPDVIINSTLCSRAIIKLLGRKSLKLIQTNRYEIDQENFKRLTEACFAMNHNIPVESVISCVLMKRKCQNTTITTIHDFSHRSQQEYFACRVLTEKLLEEYADSNKSFKKTNEYSKSKVMKMFRKLTQKELLSEDPRRILKILCELTREPVEKQDLVRLV